MKYKLRVSDVAVKQLESAVWMFAFNYDEVAVHTIAASAFELYTKRLKLLDFEKTMKDGLRPEVYTEFIRKWDKPYNFFKHGEHMWEKLDEIDYDEETVDLLIYFACEANLMGPEEYRLKCAEIYRLFFIIKNPQLIDKKVFDNTFVEAAKNAGMTIDELRTKKSLQQALRLIGHTFSNGTNTPYREIDLD